MPRRASLLCIFVTAALLLTACDQLPFGGVKLPSNWPTPDLPLPKGAVELEIYNELTGSNGASADKAGGDPDVWMITFLAPDPPELVIEAAARQLSAKGWSSFPGSDDASFWTAYKSFRSRDNRFEATLGGRRVADESWRREPVAEEYRDYYSYEYNVRRRVTEH